MAVGEQGIYADNVRACREHAELFSAAMYGIDLMKAYEA